MTVKEKLDQVAAIFRDAQAQAAPLLAELEPYVAVARECDRLGITEHSSADEIIDAFAGKLNLSVPAPTIVPQVLDAGAPGQIREAGETLLATHRAIGSLVGSVIGIIAGLR